MSVHDTAFEKCGIININTGNSKHSDKHLDEKNIKIDVIEDETNIREEDFTVICRTCLSKGRLIPIFNSKVKEVGNLAINTLLHFCVEIQAKEADGLPQNICTTCMQRLMKIYSYQKQCLLSETLLRLVYLRSEAETISVKNTSFKHVNANNDSRGNCEWIHLQNEVDKEEGNEYKTETKSKNNETKFIVIQDAKDVCGNQLEDVGDLRTTEMTTPQSFKNKNENTALTKNIEYRCFKCMLIFNSRKEHLEHRRVAKHASHKLHACNVCNKKVSAGKMKQHMRTHTKEKPFMCEFCNKGFSLSCNLKRHVMRHTGERPYVCHTCGKGFIQATSLQKHERQHNDNECNSDYTQTKTHSFTCKFCCRIFKRKGPYVLHLRKHDHNYLHEKGKVRKEIIPQEEKPYKCDICNKTYKTKHVLKSHKQTHGNRLFLCSECGKGFATNSALHSHLRTHTGERPYVCTICTKSFSHAGTFETHRLIHTGFKPYSCDLCGRNFTQQGHLSCHMKTHSGEKPYACSYCGKTFALNGNLTVHVRIHTGETPYTCNVCGRGFYDSSSRNKHQKSHEHTDKKSVMKTEKGLYEEHSNKKFVIEYKPFLMKNSFPHDELVT